MLVMQRSQLLLDTIQYLDHPTFTMQKNRETVTTAGNDIPIAQSLLMRLQLRPSDHPPSEMREHRSIQRDSFKKNTE